MSIGIFHRYPIDLVVGTNPAFPTMIKTLQDTGEDIYFVSFIGNDKEKYRNIRFREINLVFNRGNSCGKLLKTLLWILLSPFFARRLLKKDKVKLIYCDDSVPFYALFIKLFVGAKCKVLMRLGDLQTGYLFADQGVFKNFVFKILNNLETAIWKMIDGIITISLPFKKFLVKKGVDAEKISVVRECIDLDIFFPKQANMRKAYGISDEDVLVMFHGVIEPCKGIIVLLEAAKKLLPNYNNLKFAIVGDGSSFKKASCFVKDNSLKGKIILTGWVNFSRMPEFINSADIGVALRSRNMANNFVVTTALLQYWACEKPLLVPRLHAMREVVDDRINAIFFEADNVNDLAAKIEYLIKNKGMWDGLGKNGQKTAVKYFDKTKIGQDMSGEISRFLN